MRIVVVNAFPFWSAGFYGATFNGLSPTLFCDELASRSVVLDSCFIADEWFDDQHPASEQPSIDLPRFGDGQTECWDTTPSPLSDEEILAWMPPDCFAIVADELAYEEELADYDADSPAALSRALDAGQLADSWVDLQIEVREFAQFCRAVALARAKRHDESIRDRLSKDGTAESGGSIALIGLPNGPPPGTYPKPAGDVARQCLIILNSGAAAAGRVPTLCRVDEVLAAWRHAASNAANQSETRFSPPKSDEIVLRSADAVSLRTAKHLYCPGTSVAGEQMFEKPDDLWNQFNIAAVEPSMATSCRSRLEQALAD